MFNHIKTNPKAYNIQHFDFPRIKEKGEWIERSFQKVSYFDYKLWNTYIDDKWARKIGILSVVKETKRIIHPDYTEIVEYYYVSNMVNLEKIANTRRSHWQIESYHWHLDKTLHEDECIVKDVNTTTLLNIIRKVVLLLLSLPVVPQYDRKGEIIPLKNRLIHNVVNLESILTTPF